MLLEEIKPGMNLTKDFFKRVYGFSKYEPIFSEVVLYELEVAGFDGVREEYKKIVSEIEAEYDAILFNVSLWYCEQLEIEKRKELKECQKKIEQMTEEELRKIVLKIHS